MAYIIINSPFCLSQNSVISWNSILWFKLIAFCFYLFHFFWVTVCPRLTWNLLCTLGWSWTQRLTVCLLECQAHCFIYFSFFYLSVSLCFLCVCCGRTVSVIYPGICLKCFSLSFFFHYGIVLNSWFSSLRFVCAGIASSYHAVLWWYFFLFLSGDMFLFYYHHILILTELIFSKFSSKSPVCLSGLFKKPWRHF